MFGRKAYNIGVIGTGRQLEKGLIGLVEGPNWNKNSLFFYRAGSSTHDLFTISPNPVNQPGNGFVNFPLIKGNHPWSFYKDVVTSYKFKEYYLKFLENNLGDQDFSDKFTSASVLLQFEIARRAPDKAYPVTREETRNAIDKVMSAGEQDYASQASSLIDMFSVPIIERKSSFEDIMDPVSELSKGVKKL